MSITKEHPVIFPRPKLSKTIIEESQHLIEICTKKGEQIPNHKKAILLRGSIYLKLSQFEESKRDGVKLVSDPILNSTVYYLLGCGYEKQRKYEESKDYLTRAGDIDPDNVNALFLRGAIFNCGGYFQEAIDDFSLALEKDSLTNKKKNIYRNIEKGLAIEDGTEKESNNSTEIDSSKTNKQMSKNNSNSNSSNNINNKSDNNIDNEINCHIKNHFKELSVLKRSGIINNVISTTNSIAPTFKSSTQFSSEDILPSFNSNLKSIQGIDVFSYEDHKNYASKKRILKVERNTQSEEVNKNIYLKSENLSSERLMTTSHCETEPNELQNRRGISKYLTNNKRQSQQILNRIVNISVTNSICHTEENNQNISIISNNDDLKFDYSMQKQIDVGDSSLSSKPNNQNSGKLHEWEVYHEQGIVARHNREYEHAINLFTKAIELNNNYFKGYFNRAFVYDKLGKYNNAIKDYTKAIHINPNYPYTYYNRGITYEKMNLYKSSGNDFTQAISLNKKKSEFYYNRACGYKKAKLFKEAIADYSKVIKQKESFPAFLNRGGCQLKLNNYTECIKDMHKCIYLNQKNITPYCHIANIYNTKMNDYEKAGTYYQKIIKINEKYSLAYHDIGIIYEKWNSHDLAIEYFTKAIDIDKYNSIYYHNRCLAYKNKGNNELAIEDISNAINLDDENIFFHEIRALLYQENKNYNNAIDDYGFIIDNCTDKRYCVDALFKRANCLEKSNRVNEAVNDYCKIIEKEPLNANAYGKRGCCYEMGNMIALSYKDYEKSLEIDEILIKAEK